jgi:tetratricopeptide (TPR) repeat protein
MRAALIVAIALAWAHAGAADPKADARPHVEAADVAYKVGKFAEALAEYTKAYELFRAPALLFNIAQCHRNLADYERAVFFYEGFLRDAPQDAANRVVVEDLLRETRVQLEQQQRETETQRRAVEAAREKAAVEAARVRAQADARREADEDRRVAEARRQAELAAHPHPQPYYRRWWFWTAVGSAALAGGGAAYYFSGGTHLVPPTGSLGGLDRR